MCYASCITTTVACIILKEIQYVRERRMNSRDPSTLEFQAPHSTERPTLNTNPETTVTWTGSRLSFF